MKIFTNLIFFLCFMVVGHFAYAQCNYQICLVDDFGDGWSTSDGSPVPTLDVLVNGAAVQTGLTLAGGAGPECFEFTVYSGDEITTVYNPSATNTWGAENGYYIEDSGSIQVGSENLDGTAEPVGISTPVVASCPPCDFQVCLVDDFGDGWSTSDGSPVPTLDVLVGGVVAQTGLTLAGGAGPECFIFSAEGGAEITTVYNPSATNTWGAENGYYILDGDGNQIGAENLGGTAEPVGISTPVSGDCPLCVLPVATTTTDIAGCPASVAVRVTITDLGSGAPYTLSDDQGSAPQAVTATGDYTFNYAPGTGVVTYTIASDADPVGCAITDLTGAADFCPPPNDEPAGAIPLTVGNYVCTSPMWGYNTNSTASEIADPTIPAPGCASYGGLDVWYSIMVPPSGTVTVRSSNVGTDAFDDGGMALYTGAIGAFVLAACNDDGNDEVDASNSGFFSQITYTGTPGEVVYVRVWEYGENQGEFALCAWDSGAPAPPIAAGTAPCQSMCRDIVGDDWVYFMNGAGEIIGAVHPRLQDLGNTCTGVNVPGGTPQDGLGDFSAGRDWTFTPTNALTSDALVRVYFTATEEADLNAATGLTIADYNITRYATDGCATDIMTDGTGTFITQTGNGAAPAADGSYVQFSTASFSQFFIHATGSNLLPVDLISFTGKAQERGNMLEWVTATEMDNDKFELQSSHDGGETFRTIAVIDGAGNSDSPIQYEFLDENYGKSTYYRLKQIDFDGTHEFSQVINIKRVTGFDLISAFPNPTRGKVSVQLNSLVADDINLTVTNVLGQRLSVSSFQVAAGEQTLEVDMTNLQTGIYYLTIDNGTEQIVEKIVKE